MRKPPPGSHKVRWATSGQKTGPAAAARVRMVGIDTTGKREKDDFYATPPEAVDALLSVEQFEGAIWEPCCGDGAISKVLEARGHDVISTDLVDRGYGEHGVDLLMEWRPRAPNLVTNPPFKLAVPMVRKALHLTTGKVAFLLKLTFLEGVERRQLFEASPLARVWVFSRRIQCSAEHDAGRSGMMAFAWLIWEHGYTGKPEIGWL